MLVLTRVCASTCFTITAQYRPYLPSGEGRVPGTTTDPAGTRRHEEDETGHVLAQDMFQETPPHADHWQLPAHVTLTKTVSVRDSANGTPTFAADLTNTTEGSGVLSEYDDGTYRLANGADRQT